MAARRWRAVTGAAAWVPDPVDGAELLDDTEVFLRRFVAFPSEAAAVAVTLWAAHTHAVLSFDSTPRLALLSPEPGSGKTRTLEVLDLLVPRPMSVLSASPAAVFRTIEAEQPTLLIDEVDAVFRRRGSSDDGAEDLRALLNAGHRKGATIPRCTGPRHDVQRFQVYAATALAGLGDLPETLMTRSIIVRMRRRAPTEHVQPFRHRQHAPKGVELAERLAEWAAPIADQLANAWPTMPAGVEDRPADVWEPLLAMADAAGGTWPERARTACVELVQVAASGEASLGIRLLGELREVFGEAEAMFTETILNRLHQLDEAPWADLRGKPLDGRRLARMLAQYEVRSTTVKVDGKALKGYRREHLYDAWTRYLAPVPQQALPPLPAIPGRSEGMGGVTDAEPGTLPNPQPLPADPALTSHVTEVTEVTAIGEPTCTVCGRPLLLDIPGRTTCERCRLAAERSTT